MLRRVKLGEREYGFVAGPSGYIVTNDEFIHNVLGRDVDVQLNVGKPFDPEYQHFTLAELEARDVGPIALHDWGHYWGIKDRMAGNYALLLKSMHEIGLGTTAMPKWGDDDSERGAQQ